MRKNLRTALIWILMLALPTQAMAALGMQVCAAAQQAGGAAQVAHHSMASMTSVPADASVHAAHQMDTPDNASQPTGDNRLCSLCAFCVGVIALNAVAVCHAPLQAGEPSLARLDQFIGFISEPLERPPRLFLA